MAPIKLLFLASASLVLSGGMAANGGAGEEVQVTLGDQGACLAEINAAREAAGLTKFTQPGQSETTKKLPEAKANVWEPVCTKLLPEAPAPAPAQNNEPKFQSGTYAYLALDSKTPDCSAAVQKWQGAYTNFNGLPPKNSDYQAPYDNPDNVSFVALYNPGSNATADCRVVTCTKTTTTSPSTSQPTTPTTVSSPAPDFRNTPEKQEASALMCMTSPDALAGANGPFTQEQWDKITSALTSAASASVPTLLAFSLVAAGVALLK